MAWTLSASMRLAAAPIEVVAGSANTVGAMTSATVLPSSWTWRPKPPAPR